MRGILDVRVAPNGRLVLPKAARIGLGIKGASMLARSVSGQEVKLTSMRANVQRAQALSGRTSKTICLAKLC